MVEPTEEQKELTEKLKILDKNIRTLWNEKGLVTLIDGVIPIPLTKDIDESVRHFLMEYSALFGFKKDLSGMKFITKTYGLDTHHIRYQQVHEEVPVLYSLTSVHLNEESRIIMVKSNYHPEIALDTKAILNAGVSKEKAIEIAHSDLNAETRLKRDSAVNLVILPTEDEFYLTWEVSVALKNPSEGHRVYVDVRHGEIIKKMEVFRRLKGLSPPYP